MAAVVRDFGAGVVLMHMQGTPATMQVNPTYDDVVAEVAAFLQARLQAVANVGIAAEQMVLDPGIGFGKKTRHNLELLARLEEFQRLGRPVCLGVSRKGVFGKLLGRPVEQRLAGSLAAVCYALAHRAAQIVRVHDVAETRDAVVLFQIPARNRIQGERLLKERLAQLYESVGTRDLVEIAILAVAIYFVLRFLGKTRGAGIVRGLGLVVVGLFLVAQVIIASFDLTVLGRVLDYLLTTVLLGLLVIFQPELRRGLMVLGRYRHPAFLRPRRAASGRRQAGRRRRGHVARVRRRPDRHRARGRAGSVRRDGRADRRGGVGVAAAGHFQQAQPAARRGGDPVRRPARRRRLPAAAGPAAGGATAFTWACATAPRWP